MAITVKQFSTVNSVGSASGSINISAPTGIATYDLLLMFVVGTTSSLYSSTGWTTYTSYSATGFSPFYYTVLYKIADSSDVSLSNSSGSYTITTPSGTIWATASILSISGVKFSSPFTASYQKVSEEGYDYSVFGIDYVTQSSGLLLTFCGGSTRPFTGFPDGTGVFNQPTYKVAASNSGFSNILSMGFGTGGSGNNSMRGVIAYQTVQPYTNLTTKVALFSSYSSNSVKAGLQILIAPFVSPKYIMRELYDVNGNPYANGTPVYCASETTPTNVVTGAVGSWVGSESTYLTQNVALPYGVVGFGFEGNDTDRKFIYIKPNVDEYGLISEYITPTQL